MSEWRHGGVTGSIKVWVHREVARQRRGNAAMRRSRRSFLDRGLRRFFWIGTFTRFVAIYACIDLLTVVAEAVIGAFAVHNIPAWTMPMQAPSSGPPLTDLKVTLLNVGSYLITAQVGALGVISLALALVTLIAQRDNSSTDVKVYYHEALAFEVVASSIALLTVLCVQLIWPLQFLLHLSGHGTPSQLFKLALLCLHLAWLLVNLGGLAQFVMTTFGFVQQSRREALRERYTANVVQPRVMTELLRQQVYGTLGPQIAARLGGGSKVGVTFGFDYGPPCSEEIVTLFRRPAVLRDVHVSWVAWAVSNWHARSERELRSSAASGQPGAIKTPPTIWFTPLMGVRVEGVTPWCYQRGGARLTWIERWALRCAFRFGRIADEG